MYVPLPPPCYYLFWQQGGGYSLGYGLIVFRRGENLLFFSESNDIILTRDTNLQFISYTTGSIIELTNEYIPNKNIHFEVASATGSVLNLTNEYITNIKSHIEISSATGSIPTFNAERPYLYNGNLDISIENQTGSMLFDSELRISNKINESYCYARDSLQDMKIIESIFRK